ncbi:MAG: CRISPR-associated endonuclease Cas1 [Gammaproteobacteria bacterium]|nr:CRISPR-associated endonuclease Cas1 [Gammaproteobacteria bacterium]
METLYIDRKNAELTIQGGRLLVRITDRPRPFSVPLSILEFLVISASVQFSSTILTQLTLANVTVIFINPRKHEASSIATGLLHNSTDRRLIQYKAISDPEIQLRYAKMLVRQKLRGQRALLKKALRGRPDKRLPLTKGIERLHPVEQRVIAASTIETLRGIEGSSAAMYFEAYQSLFAPKLAFTGRNRRPPRDPVNAVLSLTYTMLHAEAIRVLISTGFDPHLGIYHLPTFGRESLACDLVEIYRPIADQWVWTLFAHEILRHDHFSFEAKGSTDTSCLLGKAGRSNYYSHYEHKARGWRKLMRRTSRHWLKQLQLDLQIPKLDTNITKPASQTEEKA